MPDKLVIVESPAKAKTIEKYLGSGYKVLASVGHVRDLPESNESIDVDNDFTPTYVIMPDKEQVVTQLRNSARTASAVYMATDPDREGEAIAWHIVQAINIPKKTPVHRVSFSEITPNAVKQAIANPRDIDMALVDAQQARRILDRLVGYRLSRVLWQRVRRGLSAGRVQSVAVRLVVDTGIHAKQWSREKATEYLIENTGRPRGAAQREIDRYCVRPGQACAYKIGQIAISRLRDDAKARLGTRFDLKAFHDAVLLRGGMPLTVLETVIADWVQGQVA
ncbi:MAG: DUF885 family protein [Chloroflexia bacterium]|nr:DUF885 family protein [Chloroflexia bacterium]